MGEKTQILQFRFMGVIMEADTARLYHITAKSAMGKEHEICPLGSMPQKQTHRKSPMRQLVYKVSPTDF